MTRRWNGSAGAADQGRTAWRSEAAERPVPCAAGGRGPAATRAGSIVAFLLLAACVMASPTGAQATAGGQPDWSALRSRVVDLETFMPGEETGLRSVGFVLDGLPGILTCYRLVNGADRVVVRAKGGDPIETRRCLAADAAADLILLDAPQPAAGLPAGPIDLLAPGQRAFALLPPASHEPAIPVPALSSMVGPGPASFLAVAPLGPSGAPLADSLGRVVGILELIRDGGNEAACAIPVERALGVFANVRTAEPRDLRALPPAAAWTRADTREGAAMFGAALSRIRRLDAAEPYLKRAVEPPADVAALLEWGMLLQNRGDFAGAESAYRRALELQPDLAEVHLFLGACLQSSGAHARSLEVYEEGLRRQPGSARLHVNRGGILFTQQKRDLAESEFREALRLTPHLGVAHYNLGVLFVVEGRLAEAREVLAFLKKEKSGFAAQLEKTSAGRLTGANR